MENEERFRSFLVAIKASGERVTTLGEVPIGERATVPFIARDGGPTTTLVTVTGTCEIYGHDGVTVEGGNYLKELMAEHPCLV